MAAAPPDGPSRPIGVEFGIGGGILVVTIVAIGIAAVSSLGQFAIPYFLLSFTPGILAWIPLLIVARRMTRDRTVARRVAASVGAAVLAIAIDVAVVMLVIAQFGGYWGLYLVLALVTGILFLFATVVAAFIVHLGAAARPSR